jgi:ribose-phosphate pyrophosphokinase
VVDDLVSSGTTMARAAKACRERGARRVFAAATHGLFAPAAEAVLSDPAVFDEVVVADAVPPATAGWRSTSRLPTVLDTAPLFAEAIARMHRDESLVELLEI